MFIKVTETQLSNLLEASVIYIPGFGWGMWVLGCPFLHRNWSDDVQQINRTFNALKTRKLPFWLISHCEGTRITPQKLKESQGNGPLRVHSFRIFEEERSSCSS